MRSLQIITLILLAFFATSNAAYHPVIPQTHVKQAPKTAKGHFPYYPKNTFIYSEYNYLTGEQKEFYHQMAAKALRTTTVNIISVVIEKTGKIPVQQYAKKLANEWKPMQYEGRYIFVFHFVKDKYTYFEIGDDVKGIITKETLDSLKANVYEPKLKEKRIGEGILGLAHAFAETICLRTFKDHFEVDNADIPEEGSHIYQELVNVLFFTGYGIFFVFFIVAYRRYKRKKKQAKSEYVPKF